jgi:serine/threonine protein kinase
MEKDLYQTIKENFPAIKLKEMKHYFRQIGEALKYLHQEKKEIHLDVKPENIGISGERAVLMDFEFCSKISDMNNLNYLKKIWKNRSLLYLSP